MERITMNAKDIIKLLAQKHARDLFVSECKNGSTWFTEGGLRLDAWVMKRSWASPLTIGYEVKVSRQDFLSDSKWHGYLDYCNEFYFVCPPELIQPNELPRSGPGTGHRKTRCLYKKKALYRNVTVNPNIYVYILMCRTKVLPGSAYKGDIYKENHLDYWRAWLKEKTEKRDFGHLVGRAIRDTIRNKIDKVERENNRLQHENEQLQDIKDFCTELGITSYSRWSARDTIREAAAGIPGDFMITLNSCVKSVVRFKEELDRHIQENSPAP